MSMREELNKLRAEHGKLLARRLTQIYTHDQLAMLIDHEPDVKLTLMGLIGKPAAKVVETKGTVVRQAVAVMPKPAVVSAPVANPSTVAAAMAAGW